MIFFLYFMVFIGSLSSHEYEYDYPDTNYKEYDEDQIKAGKADDSVVRYEVTENIIDVPNTESLAPIVTNFTITKPLNHATPNNTRYEENKINNGNNLVNNANIDDYDKETNNLKRNYVNILHILAEYDDKPDIHININKPSILDYIHKVKKDFINGIHSFVNKDLSVNEGINVPNIVAGPVWFLNKIHKKGTDVASKLHKAIFGHKFDDY